MPRSGAGVYVLPAGQPAITGTTISSTTFNLLTSDLANALTTSVSTDGQTPMAGSLSMGNNKITNLAVATLPGDAARFDQVNNPTTSIYYNVKTAGAVGNGIVDDTTIINAANSTATALGRTLFFPAGTYIVTQLNVLPSMKWLGESSKSTTIKYKSGTNGAAGTAMIMSATTSSADDAWIEGFTLDGNKTLNTSGDTLVFKGARPVLKDVNVINSAGNAIQTDWAGPSFRTTGFEGHFSHITIDAPYASGWIHRGPSDSFFSNIIIIDASAGVNNSAYGMYLDPTGSGSNGRFFDLHSWSRSNATNIAIAGVYVGFGGNTFDGCHFEGGYLPLNVAAGVNSFSSSCQYYAPRGPYAISMAGGTNTLMGLIGATAYSGNLNYTGLNLVGPSNRVDLVVASTITGIAFNDTSNGGNVVNVTGFLGAGGAAYTGTPAANDIINILVQGSGGGTLQQGIASPAPTSYACTITSLTGTFSNASITTAYYYQVGKIVYYDVYYTITAVGTAAGALQITLPFAASSNALGTGNGSNGAGLLVCQFTAGSQSFVSIYNNAGTSVCATTGNGHVAGWYVKP